MAIFFSDNDNSIKRSGGNGRRCTSLVHAGLVYVSGITTVNLEGDMREQTRDVLEQIDKHLLASGSDKTRVLKADITLSDMADYGDFNAVWDEWVTDEQEPCRSVIQGGLALPEYKVKVSLVAAQE